VITKKGEEMKYIIPYIPQSDNHYKGRQNVWEYRNDKKLWLELGQVYIRPRPKEPYKKATVRIKYYFKTKARHDPDNYSGKFIMDCLTEYGVIQDDSFDCVKLIIEGGYDKNNPRTEVEVTEC
jgi:Holliday junction resolvase RusA-like endonuclease